MPDLSQGEMAGGVPSMALHVFAPGRYVRIVIQGSIGDGSSCGCFQEASGTGGGVGGPILIQISQGGAGSKK